MRKEGEKVETINRRKQKDAYIEEDHVAIRVSIVSINPVKPLRELNVANFLSGLRIHHETHSFSNRLAVVDVVITVHV